MSVSLATQVYETLLSRILNNELLPGEFINRRDIAVELGVSAAPVTEAMILMETEGLLEAMPRKGTRVSIVRDSDVSGTLLIREGLECMAARMYCGAVIAADIDRLLPLAREVDQAAPRSYEYFSLDRALHIELIGLLKCEPFSQEYARITKLGLFHNTNKLLTTSEASMRKSHVELVENLCHAAPDEAHILMHQHVISGKGKLALSRVLDEKDGKANQS